MYIRKLLFSILPLVTQAEVQFIIIRIQTLLAHIAPDLYCSFLKR